MKKLFGTDGIRGRANVYPIIPEICTRVAYALAAELKQNQTSSIQNLRYSVIIAKDTRLSGYMIESALVAGFASSGIDVFLVGPMPTPAVSMLTKSLRANFGIMISASHNKYYDNGIKIFDSEGRKLSDKMENRLEQFILSDRQLRACDDKLSKVTRIDGAIGRYIEFVKNTFPKDLNLSSLKIVIDTANGALYKIAPMVFAELGAELISINDTPNGVNINENSGVINPMLLRQRVLQTSANLGIAFDGDGDRLLICDELGNFIEGDQLIALIVNAVIAKQAIDKVAISIISSKALEEYFEQLGITCVRANVGDKYISEIMRAENIIVGGEPSGHIVLFNYSPTGDAMICALKVLEYMIRHNKKLSEINKFYQPYPVVTHNLEVKNKTVLEHKKIQTLLSDYQKLLGSNGTLIVRPSGTEQLIRITIEGKDQLMIDQMCSDITNTLKALDAE